MRALAALFIASSLISVPAFAQAAVKDGGQGASAQPNTLASKKMVPTADGKTDTKSGLSLGVIDRLSVNNSAERPIAGLAPIEKDQLDLAWRPGGKWGITLDLTTRSPNDAALPREELAAGAYYQLTPRFRFGGGVMLKGDSLSSPEAWKQEQPDAGVKIESAFAF